MRSEPSLLETDEERVIGEVEHIVFTSDDSGFGVVNVLAETKEHVKAVGPLATLTVGQSVELIGRFVTHEKYGRTFNVEYYDLATPQSKTGLVKFLSSSVFNGVGETLAKRLVDEFGTEIDDVIVNEPEKLVAVRGMSLDLAMRVAAAWEEAGTLPRLVRALAEVGLGPAAARAAEDRFDDPLQVLQNNPYTFLSLRGVKWTHVDQLGRAAGIDDDDERRLAAGCSGLVTALCFRDGHTWIPQDEVLQRLPQVLGGGMERAEAALKAAAEIGTVVIDDDELPTLPSGRIAPERIHEAEMSASWHVEDLLGGASGGPKNPLCAASDTTVLSDVTLTVEQLAAVDAAMNESVSVLTGGPGTGKTLTVKEVLARAATVNATVAVCAPTGRAAKRLEEVTGHTATTVHRLLEARPVPGAGFVFGRDEDNPLPVDLVVVDEWSMADAELTAALLHALEPPTHLLIVGDVDQLPPVGAGASLRDLLGTETVTTTRLTTVHRQAAESRIVTLAHELNAGQAPVVVGQEHDVFAVPCPSTEVPERVAAIVAERAPEYFGCATTDVQVLAPMYKGPVGVDALNAALKARLNPPQDRKPVAGWHEGDRVVATRNDVELDIANGDIGEVVGTDRSEREVTVVFAHGAVTLGGEKVGQLAPAWCLTVHKSQGGEWPVVVLVLDKRHRAMLTRELVYTAITRAREGLLLVGDPTLIADASRRDGAGLAARRTTLAARLRYAGM